MGTIIAPLSLLWKVNKLTCIKRGRPVDQYLFLKYFDALWYFSIINSTITRFLRESNEIVYAMNGRAQHNGYINGNFK